MYLGSLESILGRLLSAAVCTRMKINKSRALLLLLSCCQPACLMNITGPTLYHTHTQKREKDAFSWQTKTLETKAAYIDLQRARLIFLHHRRRYCRQESNKKRPYLPVDDPAPIFHRSDLLHTLTLRCCFYCQKGGGSSLFSATPAASLYLLF